jgi:hypothetical protein
MTYRSRHISVSINRPAGEVYQFASNPENLPRWASGLGGSIRNVNGDWTADSPMGTIKIRFAEENRFGVLDHDVTLPSGQTVHNPFRVLPNADGSELIFTLYQRSEMSEEELAEDAATVTKDLDTLRDVLEQRNAT